MNETPAGMSLRRFVQYLKGACPPHARCAIVAFAVLVCWAMFPALASARCNGAAHSKPANHIGVPSSFQPLDWMQPTAAENDDDDPSIVGLWHALFLNPDGTTFDEGFDQFQSGGTEILNDTAPPQPANGAGTVCLGVFKKTGPRTYKLKHPFWSFDANGVLVATGVFLEEIIVNESGNTYTGTYDFKMFDLNGTLTFEQKGDLKAERISVD